VKVRFAAPLAILLAFVGTCTGCKQLSNPPASKTETTTTTPARHATTAKLPDRDRYGGPANFISNPSFETGISPWAPWGEKSLLRLTRAVHRDGIASVRVIATATAPYGIQLSGVVGSPGRGDAFRLSIWVRFEARPTKIELIMTAYGPGKGVQQIARDVVVGTRWTRVALNGRIRGANRDSLTVSIGVLRSVGTGDAFDIDAVSLIGTAAR
jgi:hypothetical protein